MSRRGASNAGAGHPGQRVSRLLRSRYSPLERGVSRAGEPHRLEGVEREGEGGLTGTTRGTPRVSFG
jgi:hypothetical protein